MNLRDGFHAVAKWASRFATPAPAAAPALQKIRVSFDLSPDLHQRLIDVAAREGTDLANVTRHAYATILIADQQRREGRPHMGFTSNPDNLEVELVSLFSAQTPARAETEQSHPQSTITAAAF